MDFVAKQPIYSANIQGKKADRWTGKVARQPIHSERTRRSRFTRNRFNVTWKFTPLFEFTRWFSIRHRRSMASLIFCRRLAGSDITAISSVTCMDWLCWWCNHTSDVVPPSTALVFDTKMSEKRKFAYLAQSKWKIGKRESVMKRN
jgi:hypothetical protein